MRTFAELEAAATAGVEALDALLLPAEMALTGWPTAHLASVDVARLTRGQAVPADPELPSGDVKIFAGGQFIAIGRVTRRPPAGADPSIYSLTAWSGTEYLGMMRGFHE